MGLTQHTPTDEDISNLLKEFTIDFMLKGFGNLVGELHAQLLIPTDLVTITFLINHFQLFFRCF